MYVGFNDGKDEATTVLSQRQISTGDTASVCVCVCTQLLNNGHHRVTAVRRHVSAVRDNHVT